MDNTEISPKKARDLSDLAGEAFFAGFFAAGELTRTDFDFLHDGLAFSGVARVRLLLCIGVPVRDVLATRVADTIKTSQGIFDEWQSYLTANFGKSDSKAILPFRRFEEILRRRMAFLAKISKLHFERNLAKLTIITGVRNRHLCAT